MKPGVKTTEFWVSISLILLQLLAALGKITPEQQTEFAKSATTIAAGVGAAIVAAGYSISRGIAKKDEKK